MLSGYTVMTRKENQFIQYWNEGLRKLIDSGRFHMLCQEAKKKHGRV